MSLPLVPSYLSHIANCSKQISVRATSPELSHIAKCAKQICSILLLQNMQKKFNPFVAKCAKQICSILLLQNMQNKYVQSLCFKMCKPKCWILLLQNLQNFFFSILLLQNVQNKYVQSFCCKLRHLQPDDPMQVSQWLSRGESSTGEERWTLKFSVQTLFLKIFWDRLCFKKYFLIRVPALQQWVVRGACLLWGTQAEALQERSRVWGAFSSDHQPESNHKNQPSLI